jgi:hypothetical protein
MPKDLYLKRDVNIITTPSHSYHTQVVCQTQQELAYIFGKTIPAMPWMGCVHYDVGVCCHNVVMNRITNAYAPCAWAYKSYISLMTSETFFRPHNQGVKRHLPLYTIEA